MMQDCGSMSIHTNKNLLALYKIFKKIIFFFALLCLFQNKMAEESEWAWSVFGDKCTYNWRWSEKGKICMWLQTSHDAQSCVIYIARIYI